MSGNYYLEMLDINKTFPGAKVLNHIDFKIKLGEVRALMGENGAGKSTLMKILGGIYQKDKDSGRILIEGREVEINHVDDAKKYGISIIHQEISLAENMTVYDNIFMGCELDAGIRGFLNDKEMIRRAQAIVDELKVGIDVRQKVGELSIAKQQMIEICRALLSKAKVIVMDEPTSSLTQTEIEQLFEQIRKLKEDGIAIIYISHRMEEIFQISDSITVLRDGALSGTKKACELDNRKIIEMMVGRDLDNYMRSDAVFEIGDVCLEVKNLNNKKLKDISFTLRKGEILGFAGLVGAGRSEMARAVFGIDRIDSGQILVNGREVKIRNASDAIRAGIGYVPESRKEEGLVLSNSIKFNLTISVLEQFIKGCFVNRKKETELIDEYVNKLSIKMASAEQLVQYLSGGNQQKVVVSKWLATKPDILILDEPTRGIDIGAKTEIYHLIVEMAKAGVAVLLISSEMEEIMNLSTRIVVMYEGRIKAVLTEEETKKAVQEDIMWYASGRKKDEAE